MREDRARKDARAVIVVLAAIGTKHIVVGTLLVIMLQKIFGLRRPLYKLPLFKGVQRMTNIAGVLRMNDEKIENVMK